MAAGSPFTDQWHLIAQTESAGGMPSAHPMSSGTRRQEILRLRQATSPPIGSRCAPSRGTPWTGIRYVGRARPLELPVRKLPDQVPGGQLPDRLLDLRRPDVVAAGERAWPGQPPAGLMMHQGGGEPVNQDSGDVWQ